MGEGQPGHAHVHGHALDPRGPGRSPVRSFRHRHLARRYDGGLRGRKRDATEGGTREIGLIEYPPAVKANRVEKQFPVITMDVMATVLDVLKEGNISVKEMQNTIFDDTGAASATITLDSEPTADLLSRIRSGSDDILGVVWVPFI